MAQMRPDRGEEDEGSWSRTGLPFVVLPEFVGGSAALSQSPGCFTGKSRRAAVRQSWRALPQEERPCGVSSASYVVAGKPRPSGGLTVSPAGTDIDNYQGIAYDTMP